MAESLENIAKSCENPKENGAKMKEINKAVSLTNGKQSGDSVQNGKADEISKSIISQKSSPTHSHKSLHTSPHSDASHIKHVAQKSDGKSKPDSKTAHESSSKDRRSKDGHGECHLRNISDAAKTDSFHYWKHIDDMSDESFYFS